MKKFENLSALIECASGVTPTVDSVKRYIDLLSEMGYNKLYLGMADSYKIEGEPYFDYKRGGYSVEMLKEMDSHAKEKGIELVAQIHVLSHLHFMRKYPAYWDYFDTDNVLMVGDDRVYALIDRMLKTISEGLSTRRIHLGVDEAFGIGTGDFFKKHGYADRKELIIRHLKRVFPMLEKYGLIPEIWGDMFIDKEPSIVKAEEIRAIMPNDSLVYAWDYIEKDEEKIAAIIDEMKPNGKKIGFAGGVWKYISFGPNNGYSIDRIIPQMKVCHEKGIGDYMVTLWSDNCAPCSFYAALPSLFVAAEYNCGAYDGKDEKSLDKAKFKRITGVGYDELYSLEYIDDPFKINSRNRSSSSLWVLYTDLLLGNFDLFVPAHAEEKYLELAKEYSSLANGKYAHVFKMSASLMQTLAVKAKLPTDIREAYLNGDKAKLKDCIIRIERLKSALIDFGKVFAEYFLHDNMPFGLEVRQLYDGGQIARCDYAIARINAYIEKDEKIGELDGGVVPINYYPPLTPDNSCMNDYRMLISYCIK